MSEVEKSAEVDAVKPVVEGAFVASLKRNNSKIRQDRAQSIAERSGNRVDVQRWFDSRLSDTGDQRIEE